jgi:hypothetical protein
MAEDTTKTYVFGNESQVPAWLAMNNGNGLFGNSGWGGGILGFLLGLFFGNGNFGNFGGYGAGGAGFLSNQINNDSGRELLMNAITSQGEAGRAATQNLATMVGQDFNLLNSGVSVLRDALAGLTAQTGMSALQIQNAIQSGNAALASQLCDCCCKAQTSILTQGYESRIQNMQQTEALSGAITSGNQRIVDAIADLKTTTVKEFCDARERDMQADINNKAETITQLRGQLDNAAQSAQFAAMLAPINAKLVEIEGKQPNTVPVVYPNITAVNNTPYTGGFSPYGYGWNGSSYWG